MNMKSSMTLSQTRSMFQFLVLSAGLLLVLACGTLRGANILWGPASAISGDSDVRTGGTLVEAVNQGGVPFGPVPSATVNEVTFVGWGVAGGGPFVSPGGRFTLTGTPGHALQGSNVFGSPSPPFSSLSPDYQVLLSHLVFSQNNFNANDFTGPITLTINNLTVGAPYEFQWWVNDSRPFATGPVIATTGLTSVALDPNITNSAGGVGQFAIGTFVADSTTQQITFTTTGNATGHNAFQLRAGNGDFNDNGIVDAADYTVWRDTLGSMTNLAADGNGNQVIDTADYIIWKSSFGGTAGSGGTGSTRLTSASSVESSSSKSASAFAAAPEPATGALLAAACGLALLPPSRRLAVRSANKNPSVQN